MLLNCIQNNGMLILGNLSKTRQRVYVIRLFDTGFTRTCVVFFFLRKNCQVVNYENNSQTRAAKFSTK